MPFQLYEYLDHRGHGTATEWIASIDSESRGKLRARLKALELHGGALPTTILSDTDDSSVKKIRARGRKNPRLLLCRGPIQMQSEFTLLFGVFEKDDKMPAGAVKQASRLRDEVIANPQQRRRPYVP
jgi:hypothetical protein